jgi:hypothetical protein
MPDSLPSILQEAERCSKKFGRQEDYREMY